MNEYRVQRLKEDLTFAQQRNKRQRQQLANYKKVHEKDLKEIERLNNKYNKALEKINDYKIYCKKNKGLTEYTDVEIEAIEPVISKLEDILNEVSE